MSDDKNGTLEDESVLVEEHSRGEAESKSAQVHFENF